MKKLAAFDFDWTLIDLDSDMYTLTTLSPSIASLIPELRFTIQWTDLINHLFALLHHHHRITKDQIISVLSQIKISEPVKELLKYLKENYDVYVISDANEVYISEILKANGCVVDGIISNKAWFEGDLFRVERLVKREDSHGCDIGSCAVNLCKGLELKTLINKKSYEKVAYAGDGRNDYCPCTKLKSSDVVLCRKGRALEKLLRDGKVDVDCDGFDTKVKEKIIAKVYYFDDSGDLLRVFKEFVE